MRKQLLSVLLVALLPGLLSACVSFAETPGERFQKVMREMAELCQSKKLIATDSRCILPKLQPYAGGAMQWVVKEAGTVGGALLQFLLTVVIAAIMYSTGEQAATGVRAFGRRLAGVHGEQAVTLGGQAIRGVALGVVVTALAQSVLGGIGLAISGVPPMNGFVSKWMVYQGIIDSGMDD